FETAEVKSSGRLHGLDQGFPGRFAINLFGSSDDRSHHKITLKRDEAWLSVRGARCQRSLIAPDHWDCGVFRKGNALSNYDAGTCGAEFLCKRVGTHKRDVNKSNVELNLFGYLDELSRGLVGTDHDDSLRLHLLDRQQRGFDGHGVSLEGPLACELHLSLVERPRYPGKARQTKSIILVHDRNFGHAEILREMFDHDFG